jgi:hypothetical protein
MDLGQPRSATYCGLGCPRVLESSAWCLGPYRVQVGGLFSDDAGHAQVFENVKQLDFHAGGRERGRPGPPQRGCRAGDPGAGRGGVSRDKGFSPSTPGVPAARTLRGGVARWGCSRTGPARS